MLKVSLRSVLQQEKLIAKLKIVQISPYSFTGSILVLQYHPWHLSRRGILVHGDLNVVDGVCLHTFETMQLKAQPLAQLQVVRILHDNLVAVMYETVS